MRYITLSYILILKSQLYCILYKSKNIILFNPTYES
jgi:hypothetical protein